MAKLLGIEPHWGKVSVYDALSETKNYLCLEYHCNYPNECQHMFSLIRHRLQGLKIGNVVVACDGSDSNEFRKACILAAKANGFEKIRLLSRDVAFYIQAVYHSIHRVYVQNWICVVYIYGDEGICMQIWHKEEEQAVMEHSFQTDHSDFYDWEYLREQIQALKALTQIIFIVEAPLKAQFIKTFDIKPKTFEYNYGFFSDAALCKARISAGLKSLDYLGAKNTLNRDITITIGEITVLEIDRSTKLPYKNVVTVELEGYEAICKVNEKFRDTTSKAFTLPQSLRIDIMFTINENGIYAFAAENATDRRPSTLRTLKTPILTPQCSIISSTSNDISIASFEASTYLLPDKSTYIYPGVIGIDFGNSKCLVAVLLNS